MKFQVLAVVLVLMSSSIVGVAQARTSASAVMATFNGFMYNQDSETTTGGGSASGESKTSIYDFKLGYVTAKGLYLGGIYTMRNVKSESTTSDGKNTGASLGYIGAAGFFVQGHYIFSSENGDFKEGTGLQADLGYINNVTGNVLVGVELTYRSIEYKKHETDASIDKYKSNELFPMFSVGFIF